MVFNVDLPSGKHTKKLWKDPPCYSWVNPLFLWPFSIDQRVYGIQYVSTLVLRFMVVIHDIHGCCSCTFTLNFRGI